MFVRKSRSSWLKPDTVLFESGGLPDTPAGWSRYREYLTFLAEEDVKLRDKQFSRLSRGWVVGSTEFKQRLKEDLMLKGAEPGSARLLGTGTVPELHAEDWEDKLVQAARLLHVSLGRLPPRKSAPEKVSGAAVMKARTSVSNAWLANRLAMGEPASVSQFVRRFKLEK